MLFLGLICKSILILVFFFFWPPPISADDFGHEKLAVQQYIHREFREADEANLIDEIGIQWMHKSQIEIGLNVTVDYSTMDMF